MMQGFKTFLPATRGANLVNVSKKAIVFGASWTRYLTAESYNLGYDGKRFCLEPAEGKTGVVLLHATVKGGPKNRCVQKSVVEFVRKRLELAEDERIALRCNAADGCLIFGLTPNVVRSEDKDHA